MNVLEYLKNNFLYFDGGFGTLLYERGLPAGVAPERWNITNPDDVTAIHKSYFDAGSNVATTNTFGASILKFDENELDDIVRNAVMNADRARNLTDNSEPKFIALDMGPTGKMLKPFGDLEFEECVNIFAHTVKLGVKYGVDLVIIETMNDSLETKAALLAVKENSNLPVFVSNVYGSDSKLMSGADPYAMAAMLEGMGAHAVGMNCSLGPKQLEPAALKLLEVLSVPMIMQPNAGLPETVNGKTVFNVSVEEYADVMASLCKKGLRIMGGCCGTTPEYIKALRNATKDLKPVEITKKNLSVVSSYTHAVRIGEKPVLIGERINPTGKKRFKQALKEHDMSYILAQGVEQQDAGAHILDVNTGIPEVDEKAILTDTVRELQAVIDLPLQIDSTMPEAMESALRIYNGKAMINSVNGKEESMKTVFPLVKKYGGVVVALTLDENGIPDTWLERVNIAERILKKAEEYGIDKKDIIFDTLCMTVSADKNAAITTVRALKEIKQRFGCHTSLGVSNVSFGLPQRDIVNGAFFSFALENGLDAGIINPNSAEIMKTYRAYNVLHANDENCSEYIAFAESVEAVSKTQNTAKKQSNAPETLYDAVIKGFKDLAETLTKEALKTREPLDVVNKDLIPALDEVGRAYEEKRAYLPQLLMSAEAAKSAFSVIKNSMSGKNGESKGTFVIATVKNDVHDIGKNIVKLLLENYGYEVIDLGKDVSAQSVVDAVIKYHAPIAGLSALMTTTLPSMEQTVKLIKKKAPWCKTVVGGAVLTKEYAESIGADKYSSDAMETVRYAEKVLNN